MSIADELALLANTKEGLRVSLELSKDVPFSQYNNHLMRWQFSALFMSGERGVWYNSSIMSTLFQSSSGATPVSAIGDPVGLMLDRSGNDNHATQEASSFRPTYTLDPSGAPVLLGDGVDDAMATPPATYSGTSYINTSYGWYKSSVQEGVAASLPLTWLREYVAREGAASVADDDRMRSYFATEQKLMIVMARNLVINSLRMFSGGSETTVVAIGDNGATAEKQLSLKANQTWDLSAEGLTAPALLVFDSNTALVNFYCHTNQLTGWSGGSVSNTIVNFRAQNNLLTQTAVDGLLVAFDAAGRATGTLRLEGTNNSTPSAIGKAAADNLRAKGWTVTVNGY